MYLEETVQEMTKVWPSNRRITIVCHGHSIPCGYMAENIVRPMDAYPQLLLGMLADRYPHAVCSVITTAIGGENSRGGAKRFKDDVLSLKPDVVTIDYGRNDMFLDKEEMISNWSSMITAAKEAGAKVILITPAIDSGVKYYADADRKLSDEDMNEIIINLAKKYEVGLADVHNRFSALLTAGHRRVEFCSSLNHINRAGHLIVAQEILNNFIECATENRPR